MTPPTSFIGCDVGKDTIVVFNTRTNRKSTLRNTQVATPRPTSNASPNPSTTQASSSANPPAGMKLR